MSLHSGLHPLKNSMWLEQPLSLDLGAKDTKGGASVADMLKVGHVVRQEMDVVPCWLQEKLWAMVIYRKDTVNTNDRLCPLIKWIVFDWQGLRLARVTSPVVVSLAR